MNKRVLNSIASMFIIISIINAVGCSTSINNGEYSDESETAEATTATTSTTSKTVETAPNTTAASTSVPETEPAPAWTSPRIPVEIPIIDIINRLPDEEALNELWDIVDGYWGDYYEGREYSGSGVSGTYVYFENTEKPFFHYGIVASEYGIESDAFSVSADGYTVEILWHCEAYESALMSSPEKDIKIVFDFSNFDQNQTIDILNNEVSGGWRTYCYSGKTLEPMFNHSRP